MIDHVTEWLGAYHDGELRGMRLQQIEQHLAECSACRSELEELRSLSELLHEPAEQAGFLPTERFVANLVLSMPRRSEKPPARSALNIGWWLVPVSLLGIWLFLNITFSFSSLVTIAVEAGFLDGHVSWLQGSSPQMSWYSAAMGLFGDRLAVPFQAVLVMVNDAQLFLLHLVVSLIPQLVLAVLYLGWLFSWWLRHQAQAGSDLNRYSQS